MDKGKTTITETLSITVAKQEIYEEIDKLVDNRTVVMEVGIREEVWTGVGECVGGGDNRMDEEALCITKL